MYVQQNIELRKQLAAEKQANIEAVKQLATMSATQSVSDLLAKTNRREITAGRTALALSRVQTEIGQTDLMASAEALAVARAETMAGHAELMASVVALALSRSETSHSQSGLAESEEINKTLKLANLLLEANEVVLEKLVEERTAALMHEIEERHRAEETLHRGEKLQSIGEITGGIAHDFNNIIQVVVGGTELLRRRLTDERQIGLLEMIDKAAESAKILVSRLLTFARKQALQPKVFDLNERLAGMSDLLRPMLGPNIRLEHDFASDLWPVMADPNQLEVAILNLAVNASDAMAEGGTLTLRTHNAELQATFERLEGEYICLAVTDTGSGMSVDVLRHVFEPFFTTKGIGKGTGLGLAQVYGFAKQSGGDVTIASEPEQGTTIFFHLPRPTATALASAARQEELPNGGSTHSGLGKMILVVDDNPDVASLTISMLEIHGYATRSAATAAEALACLDAGEPIDCVLSDIVMPGLMNGLQLESELRLLYPKLPVVLSTGYSRALTEGSAQAYAEVLSKPYRGHELTAALDRAFSKMVSDRP